MIMINEDGSRIELIFGTGDIGMNPGAYIDNKKVVGCMIFYNQEPREIGLNNADIKAGMSVNVDDFPVSFKFNKIESVDVVIHALEDVKTEMMRRIRREEERYDRFE